MVSITSCSTLTPSRQHCIWRCLISASLLLLRTDCLGLPPTPDPTLAPRTWASSTHSRDAFWVGLTGAFLRDAWASSCLASSQSPVQHGAQWSQPGWGKRDVRVAFGCPYCAHRDCELMTWPLEGAALAFGLVFLLTAVSTLIT